MAALPTVREIRSYLMGNTWRQSATWRGASVWSHPDGYEVLLPPSDDLGDTGLRIRELLTVLAAAEHRPVDDIAVDIGAPADDVQSFRTFPDGMPAGFIPLKSGIDVLRSVQALLGGAARTVLEGPLPQFSGKAPPSVSDLLRRVRLGPAQPGSYVVTVRVPANGPDDPGGPAEPLGRQAARQLHEAVTAVRAATDLAGDDGVTAFDDAVTAGVSADLCEALTVLAGSGQAQPFEVSFRWGRGAGPQLNADTVHFAEGAGRVISAAARHLRQVRISGPAEVGGYVESLHDRPETADRWRIKVRGDLTTPSGTTYSRSVWIRLDGQDSYDRAIVAHRDQLLVRARGEMDATSRRVELAAGSSKFEVIG
jgi:hypothetical protein